jgi:hypothetical protein
MNSLSLFSFSDREMRNDQRECEMIQANVTNFVVADLARVLPVARLSDDGL